MKVADTLERTPHRRVQQQGPGNCGTRHLTNRKPLLSRPMDTSYEYENVDLANGHDDICRGGRGAS
jgi:hypothetical protein